MPLIVEGGLRSLRGEITVPSSKYHSHRALILASLAQGTSRIRRLSDSRQTGVTAGLLRSLGTAIEVDGDTTTVTGGPYRSNGREVSVGASGTTLYLALGLMSLADRPVTVVGQSYFRRRPIGALLRSLEDLGVHVDSSGECAPFLVRAARPLGGATRIAGTLSQWISGLLLVAPFARQRTVIEVEGEFNERSFVELTVSMMRRFGLDVDVSPDWRTFEVAPGQQARSTDLVMPPDIGSAAFGLAAAAIHPADVLFRGLTRSHGDQVDHPEGQFLDIVRRMGLPMEFDADAGAVRVRHDGLRLEGATVDCRSVPDMLPILSGLAAFAQGPTVFDHIEHVRLKECDRVAAIRQLNRMGGSVEAKDGRLVVHGGRPLVGADLSSFNDHRVLMALAVTASGAVGRSTLTYPRAYRTSYPGFLDAMTSLGVPMTVSTSGVSGRQQGPRVPRDAVIDAGRPITDWVRQWARQRPQAAAVIEASGTGGTELSWKELDDAADRVATFLAGLGVGAGDSVAFQLPNWREFPVVSLAVLRLGAVCCPLMPVFREREVSQALRRSGARVLIVPEEFRGRDYPGEIASLMSSPGAPPDLCDVIVVGRAGHSRTGAGAGLHWHDYARDADRTHPDRPLLARRAPAPDMRAQLLFTSGTTGEPKGVVHRHRSLTLAAAMQSRHLGLTPADRVFVPSPLAHQTGFLYGMWLAFLLGAPQLLQDTWDPQRALEAVRDSGATFVQAATPFLDDLLRAVDSGADPPASLRVFVVTGAAIPRTLARRAARTLGVSVCGAWGSTETCLATLGAPGDEPETAWGSDGRALPGVAIRVTRHSTVLPAGAEGELEVLTPTMFTEYLGRPASATEAFAADGWYRTGDLAEISGAGQLRITGRIKDVINRGGEKIPVSEVEQLLHGHPAIREAAVVAMPDERLGERACAFVALKDGARLDLDDLQAHLRAQKLTKQYWPERLEVVGALPRNPVGKVQKVLLREAAARLAAPAEGGILP